MGLHAIDTKVVAASHEHEHLVLTVLFAADPAHHEGDVSLLGLLAHPANVKSRARSRQDLGDCGLHDWLFLAGNGGDSILAVGFPLLLFFFTQCGRVNSLRVELVLAKTTFSVRSEGVQEFFCAIDVMILLQIGVLTDKLLSLP